MKPEATLYLQLLVGLIDRAERPHQRSEVLGLAGEYGFAATLASDRNDPTITRAPMVSQELLGIWQGKPETSVLVFHIIPVDSAHFRIETERFRSLVARILHDLDQVSVYWFPAILRPSGKTFENILLKPAEISRAEELEFPDLRYVFGRCVSKTLSVIRGPLRSGLSSFVVYRSDWSGSPLFIPNSDWAPPYGELGQNVLIEAHVKERYPFTRALNLRVLREPEWRCCEMKKTGDVLKARTHGEYANYTFQFAVIDAAEIVAEDPSREFPDLKGRICCFRTLEELFAHPTTREHNQGVLAAMQNRLAAYFPAPAKQE